MDFMCGGEREIISLVKSWWPEPKMFPSQQSFFVTGAEIPTVSEIP